VVARPGARTKLVLPDGTQVWLNSNSKVKYAADFNIHSREVELEGEAYFDVVKDMQRPFIVHASSIDVRVLGTTFTIKSYPQDETIEATLLRGAIEVSGRDNPNAPRVILKPDEKLVLDKHLLNTTASTQKVTVEAGRPQPVRPDISVNPIRANIPDSEKVETAWLYNRLVFNGDSFKELAKKMERWYNVRIIFRDESLYKYRFGGAFANETVENALTALQLTAPFTYKINGDDIELFEK
jgi:ferric-dicitrate binding protein FerR (iron transport regulator)